MSFKTDSYLPRSRTRGAAIVWILIFFAVLAGGAAYFLFFKHERRVDRSGKGLASIAFKQNVVESKEAGELAWIEAILNQSLFAGDSVKTNEKATAIVQFDSGDAVRVDENSLIVIRDLKKTADGQTEVFFDVMSGRIEARARNLKLVLKTPLSDTIVAGADGMPSHVALTTTASTTSVAVLEGQAKSLAQGSEVILTKNQALVIDTEGAKDLKSLKPSNLSAPPAIESPEQGAQFILKPGESEQGIRFAWQGDSQVLIEVAQDSNFQKPVFVESATSSPIAVKLGKGEYFWRAAALGPNGLYGSFSNSRDFTVVNQEDAKVVEKKQPSFITGTNRGTGTVQKLTSSENFISGSKIGAGEGVRLSSTSSVEFTAASSSEMVVSLRSDSTAKFNSIAKGASSFAVDYDLLKGEAIIFLDPKAPLSIVQKLHVGSHALNFDAAMVGGSKAKILVENIDGQNYRLTVLEGGFASHVNNLFLKPGQQLSSQSQTPSAYVEAVDVQFGKPIEIIAPGEIPLIRLLMPKEASKVFVATNKKMTASAQALAVSDGAALLVVNEHATYYWMYQATSQQGSKQSSFVVKKAAPKPKPVSRVKVGYSSPVSTVSYSSKHPEIEWSWPRDSRAVASQVEVFRDQAASQSIFQSERVRSNKLIALVDVLTPGTYFWRVRYFDFRGRGVGTTELRQLNLNKVQLPQPLVVSSPKTGLATRTASVKVEGRAPSSKGALTVAGKSVAIGGDGAFTTQAQLRLGVNNIDIVYQSPKGKITIENKKVIYTK